MKTEIKKLWVDALKSGEYKQATGCLKNTKGYCCLGVLTDLYHKETGIGFWREMNGQSFFYPHAIAGSEATRLPFSVCEWAGIDPSNQGRYGALPTSVSSPTGFSCNSLADLNDHDTPFEQIADVIEKQL